MSTATDALAAAEAASKTAAEALELAKAAVSAEAASTLIEGSLVIDGESAKLDGLPTGATVRDNEGDTWTKQSTGLWTHGSLTRTASYLLEVWEPVTIASVPTPAPDLGSIDGLAALPVGAEVRDRDGDTWRKLSDGTWTTSTYEDAYGSQPGSVLRYRPLRLVEATPAAASDPTPATPAPANLTIVASARQGGTLRAQTSMHGEGGTFLEIQRRDDYAQLWLTKDEAAQLVATIQRHASEA